MDKWLIVIGFSVGIALSCLLHTAIDFYKARQEVKYYRKKLGLDKSNEH